MERRGAARNPGTAFPDYASAMRSFHPGYDLIEDLCQIGTSAATHSVSRRHGRRLSSEFFIRLRCRMRIERWNARCRVCRAFVLQCRRA